MNYSDLVARTRKIGLMMITVGNGMVAASQVTYDPQYLRDAPSGVIQLNPRSPNAVRKMIQRKLDGLFTIWAYFANDAEKAGLVPRRSNHWRQYNSVWQTLDRMTRGPGVWGTPETLKRSGEQMQKLGRYVLELESHPAPPDNPLPKRLIG